jgi:hypothetical protein
VRFGVCFVTALLISLICHASLMLTIQNCMKSAVLTPAVWHQPLLVGCMLSLPY